MDEQTWTDTQLEELAREHGYSVSARQLERWHKADVLPRPIQDAHVSKGTRSYYLPGTDAYVLAACRLRDEGKGRPLWRLRFELWWEGLTIPADKARASLLGLLSPTHALLEDQAEMDRALEEIAELEQETGRKGLAAHVRQALRGRAYEAVDLMTLIVDLLAGEDLDPHEPIDRIVGPRTFADALEDVLTFDGTRQTTATRDTIFGGGAAQALTEVTRVTRQDPVQLLERVTDERLLAARDGARALSTALPTATAAQRQLYGQDLPGFRFLRQAEQEVSGPAARAQQVLTFAGTNAFDEATLSKVAALAAADERRFAAMQQVLETIPESRILEEGVAAFDALPQAMREALTERIRAFLAAHPEVEAALKD